MVAQPPMRRRFGASLARRQTDLALRCLAEAGRASLDEGGAFRAEAMECLCDRLMILPTARSPRVPKRRHAWSRSITNELRGLACLKA